MIELKFVNSDARPKIATIRCDTASMAQIMAWYGAYHAGDRYTVYADGEKLSKDKQRYGSKTDIDQGPEAFGAPNPAFRACLNAKLEEAQRLCDQRTDPLTPDCLPWTTPKCLATKDAAERATIERVVEWLRGVTEGYKAAAKTQGKRVGSLCAGVEYAAYAIERGEWK